MANKIGPKWLRPQSGVLATKRLPCKHKGEIRPSRVVRHSNRRLYPIQRFLRSEAASDWIDETFGLALLMHYPDIVLPTSRSLR